MGILKLPEVYLYTVGITMYRFIMMNEYAFLNECLNFYVKSNNLSLGEDDFGVF